PGQAHHAIRLAHPARNPRYAVIVGTATAMLLFASPSALRATGGEIVLELVPAAHATPAAKVHRLADEPRRERAKPPEQGGRRGEEDDVDGEAIDGRTQRQDRRVARRRDVRGQRHHRPAAAFHRPPLAVDFLITK